MENSAPLVPEAPTRLWLPGLGAADPEVRRVAREVRDYDEALRLARHEETGDWVVVIGDQGFPVMGFGKRLPEPGMARVELAKRDTKRHGQKMLDQLAREAQRRRDDAKYRAEEQNGELAEHYLSTHRRLKGETGTLRGRAGYQGGVHRGKGFE